MDRTLIIIVLVIIVLGTFSSRLDKALARQGDRRNLLLAIMEALGGTVQSGLQTLIGLLFWAYIAIAVIMFFGIRNECRKGWISAAIYENDSTAEHVVEALLWPLVLTDGPDCKIGY